MGKSSKKTNVEVAPVVPAVPAKPVKKGKRDAEVALEKEVSAKRQKKDIEKVVLKEDTKNLKKALKDVPPKKKPETSSSEDDSSSDSEEEEPAKTVPASDKKVLVAAKNGSAAAVTKKGKESSSSESDSDEDEKPAKAAPQSKKTASSKNGTPAAAAKKEESSDSDSDSDDSDEEDAPKAAKVVPAAKKQATTVTNAKKKDESESDSDMDDDDDDDDEDEDSDESSDDEPSKQNQAKKSTEAPKKSSDSSEESSDEESEDEKPLKTPKKDLDVKMKDANAVSAEKLTATKSENKTNQTPGSRTLFVGNLSFNVGQDDVVEFFKEAGEVVEVRLSAAEDGTFKGFGHVEFATEEVAKKALELNGQELYGRAVRLDLARERGSYTPQSGKDSYQRGNRGQSQTIFVKGFDRSLAEDEIRSSLEEHFGSCGEITRISIPKDYETGASKGIAYIDFPNQDAFNKAFELNGSDLGGYSLTVDEARPKADNRDGGFSGGRDGGRSGGRFGGRSGGRGGRGDRGRGRGRDFGGRGRGRGGTPFRQSAGTASTGKKTTFSDD
ncbi:nucleolin 1-like isoform X2 [Zingiber officinale]|uniref:nucleolin 1-like isoform X2 n=1 Tax=Zingiber officinale TaxID=94328 RepID=UPI001C4C8282|nr:nucleolin 1-like isoform X2 [Zingiber officinale]